MIKSVGFNSEKADKGIFRTGETVKIGYVDQSHTAIDPEKTVYQVISGESEIIQIGGRSMNARAYVARFNFSGADQEKKCGVLSGGERNRLHLALMNGRGKGFSLGHHGRRQAGL